MPIRVGPSLVSVPELLEFIGHHLALPDLVRCTLTCRLWHQTLSPLLWQTFDDSLYSWPTIMLTLHSEASAGRRDKAWLDALFSKYGHHIRTLRMRWHSTVLAASDCGRCTQLVSLQLSDLRERLRAGDKEGGKEKRLDVTNFAIPTIVEDAIGSQLCEGRKSGDEKKEALITAERFWALLYLNSSTLQSLRLDTPLRNMCKLRSFDTLDKIVSGLQNLVELSNTMYSMDVDLILQQIPSLRSIKGTLKLDTPSVSFNNIRFFDATIPLNPLTFRQCLIKFPNLECLCLPWLLPLPHPTTDQQQQQQQQQPILYQLQELRLTQSPDALTCRSARLVFSWLPYLRHITLDALHKNTANMLVIYCKGLESFRQLEDKKPYHTPVTTDAILILLQGCPKLIVLDTPQHQIRAETLLASPPWASSRLETLRCMIVGVSRLSPDDIKILIELSVVGSSKNVFLTKQVRNALKTGRETMGQQQQVFKRLASLTHLKVLELAYRRPRDFRRESGQNIDHFTDTLELTLDSGLGQLAALKNLEMFGFEGCYHLIDRPELDWMVKSWPRLRVMCGLQQNDELTSGFEMRKRDMRSYMQQIRPDIQQHGGPRYTSTK